MPISFAAIMRQPNYEPVKRKCGGSRIPVWVSHRFPIKGGISSFDVMRAEIYAPSTLFRRLTAAKT